MFEPFVYRGRLVEWRYAGNCRVDLDLGFGVALPGKIVDLAGVHCPFPSEEEGAIPSGAHGAALDFSNQFMPPGSKVILKVSRGAGNRWLAEIALAGNTVAGTVNEALVRAGHATRDEPERHDD